MNKFYISELHIYPIKSLGSISLQESDLEEKGLKYDRRWLLIDEAGVFITQRKHFSLALLQVSIENDILTVSHKTDPDRHVSFPTSTPSRETISVSIWDDTSQGIEVDPKVSEWFSDFLKMKVRLVVMPDAEKRFVDPRYAGNEEIVSFADAYPCLIIGQCSLNNLNEKLDDPVLMDRFRPNFVFTGGDAHVEDSFGRFTLGDNAFTAVKPCARCVLTTVNQQTGLKGHEPLRTLASYRTINKKVMFGQNLIHKGNGTIHVGDELIVKSWK